MNKEEIDQFIDKKLEEYHKKVCKDEYVDFFYQIVAKGANGFFTGELNLNHVQETEFPSEPGNFQLIYQIDGNKFISLHMHRSSNPRIKWYEGCFGYSFNLDYPSKDNHKVDKKFISSAILSRLKSSKLDISRLNNELNRDFAHDFGSLEASFFQKHLMTIKREFNYDWPVNGLNMIDVSSRPELYSDMIVSECKLIYGAFKPIAYGLERNFPKFGEISAERNAKLKELSDRLFE